MKISELLEGINITKDIDIKGIANNSNEIKPGFLFIALKGTHIDGSKFIEDAINRGASAVVCESESVKKNGVIFIKVDSSLNTMVQAAKRFYGDPSSKLKVIGITGTNGKTTVSFLIKNILETQGTKTGLLGTIDYIIGDRKIPAVLTTPDILKVNQYLSQMVEEGCGACVMEVSSHALSQGRVEGIDFKLGVYTNLGRDHLDYHKTQENYLEAKTKLFKRLSRNSWSIINVDDPYSNGIILNTLSSVIGYGINNVSIANTHYKIKAKGINISSSGMKFSVYASGFEEGFSIETKLIGYHNIYNILAAVGAGLANNVSIDAIKEGVYATREVQGRLERVDLGQPFNIFIDYAHTPDALENVLQTLKIISKGRIILVFGCGGDRDKEKRSLMGRIAGRMADYSFITTDNPRTEDPMQIISEIEKGFISDNYKIMHDRQGAIKTAIDFCRQGDVLLIAGKGHENYQILKHTVVPFSDRAVVEGYLTQPLCTRAG